MCPKLGEKSRVWRLGEGRPLATKTQLRGLPLGPQTQLHNTNSDNAEIALNSLEEYIHNKITITICLYVTSHVFWKLFLRYSNATTSHLDRSISPLHAACLSCGFLYSLLLWTEGAVVRLIVLLPYAKRPKHASQVFLMLKTPKKTECKTEIMSPTLTLRTRTDLQ